MPTPSCSWTPICSTRWPSSTASLDGWLNEGFDIVYAYQAPDRPQPWWTRASRGLFYGLMNATADVPIPPDAGDFRLLSRRAYEALRQLGERQRLMKGLYNWIGFRQKGIPFTPPPRQAGTTHYSPIKLGLLAIEGITAFSVAPLRLAVWVGVALAIFSGGYGVWTVFEKFYWGVSPPGYPTLAVLVSMIGAAQLIFLGVIGEYLGKVLIEVKGRPCSCSRATPCIAARPPARRGWRTDVKSADRTPIFGPRRRLRLRRGATRSTVRAKSWTGDSA